MVEIIDFGNSIKVSVAGHTYAFRCPIKHTARDAHNIYVLCGWEIRAINLVTGLNTNLCYLVTKAVDVIKMIAAHGIFIMLVTSAGWYRYDTINARWLVGSINKCEGCGGQIDRVCFTVTPAGSVESHYSCKLKKTANLFVKNIQFAFDQAETTGRIFNNRFVEIIAMKADQLHRIQFIDIRTGYSYAFPETATIFNIERHKKNTVITATCKPSNAKCSYDGTYIVLKAQKAAISLGPLPE